MTRTKPGIDHILGSNTLKELEVVLDFRTNEITLVKILVPMRDINNLTLNAQFESHGLWTTSSIKICSKNLKADLSPLKFSSKFLSPNMKIRQISEHLRMTIANIWVPHNNHQLKPLQEFDELFDGILSDCDWKPVFLQLMEGAKPYFLVFYHTPKYFESWKKKTKDNLTWESFHSNQIVNGLCLPL